MSSLFFLFSLFFLSLLHFSLSQPKGIFIDCGATSDTTVAGIRWLADGPFVSAGTPRESPAAVEFPTLATSRSFPIVHGRKFCYVTKAYRGASYVVRTTYFYYGGAGDPPPSIFDQTVDGTLWSMVNTTEDFARGRSTYFEGVFRARGNTISVCLAANEHTDSEPFISALEFVLLDESVYNSTDFDAYGLHLVERTSFGFGGPNLISYPDDKFNRYWNPYGTNSPSAGPATVNVSGFWNVPPLKIFGTELSSRAQAHEPMTFRWPGPALPEAQYYVAMYFAESKGNGSEAREFGIAINGVTFHRGIRLTRDGIAVFAARWPLSGPTTISLTPSETSVLGPLINGGEVFELLPLGGQTFTRDVISLEVLKENLQNYPSDWSGDPCFPRQYSWTGVSCSDGPRVRVIALNLTGMGISGTLSPRIAKMTALEAIWLGSNKLSGHIPNFGPLRRLETLHLEENGFTGEIPASLGDVEGLRELFLQNNNLEGVIPSSLIQKQDLDMRLSGNLLVSPAPS